MASVVSLKTTELRKLGYDNIEEWLENPDNLYTGRPIKYIYIWRKQYDKAGNVIMKPNGKEPLRVRDKHLFRSDNPRIQNIIKKGSKWANPFNITDHHDKEEMRQTLIKYVVHLFISGLILDIDEIRGKNLGCFCVHQQVGGIPNCHAQVLYDLVNKCYGTLQEYIKSHKK